MSKSFIVQPTMSYQDFNELLAEIQIKGVRAVFKRPLVVGDKAGPPTWNTTDPTLIGFIDAKGLVIENLHIEWDAVEDTVILTRWKVL